MLGIASRSQQRLVRVAALVYVSDALSWLAHDLLLRSTGPGGNGNTGFLLASPEWTNRLWR
jgi:hypothetical protein